MGWVIKEKVFSDSCQLFAKPIRISVILLISRFENERSSVEFHGIFLIYSNAALGCFGIPSGLRRQFSFTASYYCTE